MRLKTLRPTIGRSGHDKVGYWSSPCSRCYPYFHSLLLCSIGSTLCPILTVSVLHPVCNSINNSNGSNDIWSGTISAGQQDRYSRSARRRRVSVVDSSYWSCRHHATQLSILFIKIRTAVYEHRARTSIFVDSVIVLISCSSRSAQHPNNSWYQLSQSNIYLPLELLKS